jgi:hypothetical protein
MTYEQTMSLAKTENFHDSLGKMIKTILLGSLLSYALRARGLGNRLFFGGMLAGGRR